MEADKWFSHLLSEDEFRQFVIESLGTKANKKAFIGYVRPEAAKRIKDICGITVTKIMADSGAIRHSYERTYHNLEQDDIFHIADVINTAMDIELSTDTNQNNQVLYFRKDINGMLTFVEEVRAKHDGWLALVTCYRKRKAGRRSDAT
ncbi:hypothetical protein AGMMS50293_00710 [Spirochaetia bacterium]|nr:hypothetical protein AGMMS50293_00710 [Spirochaetia bacterium]